MATDGVRRKRRAGLYGRRGTSGPMLAGSHSNYILYAKAVGHCNNVEVAFVIVWPCMHVVIGSRSCSSTSCQSPTIHHHCRGRGKRGERVRCFCRSRATVGAEAGCKHTVYKIQTLCLLVASMTIGRSILPCVVVDLSKVRSLVDAAPQCLCSAFSRLWSHYCAVCLLRTLCSTTVSQRSSLALYGNYLRNAS